MAVQTRFWYAHLVSVPPASTIYTSLLEPISPFTHIQATDWERFSVATAGVTHPMAHLSYLLVLPGTFPLAASIAFEQDHHH
jgi:hypothetical protein